MAQNRNEVPTAEQVKAVVWDLLRAAKSAATPDHGACAKYAELLLKRGVAPGGVSEKNLDSELLAEIEGVHAKAAGERDAETAKMLG